MILNMYRSIAAGHRDSLLNHKKKLDDDWEDINGDPENWDTDRLNLSQSSTQLILSGVVDESVDDYLIRNSMMNLGETSEADFENIACFTPRYSGEDIADNDFDSKKWHRSTLLGVLICTTTALMCVCGAFLIITRQNNKSMLDTRSLSKTISFQVREACNTSCSGTDDCILSNLAGSCLEMQKKVCDKYDSSASVKVLGRKQITLDCQDHS